MIFLAGGGGFVGSAYARLFDRLGIEYRILTRDNAAEFQGASCDVLIDANGNSSKQLAQREPVRDFDLSVRSVVARLESIRARRYVYLSSGDVYPDPSSPTLTREEAGIATERQSRYGLHKLLAEHLVRGCHDQWLIVRMGGFVGPGIKKNAIFDMLTGGPVWLSPDSELQFISTDAAAAIVWDLCQQGTASEIVNLGATGLVNLGALHRSIGSASEFRADARKVRYELSLEKLAKLYRGQLPNSLSEVTQFIATWKPA